MTVLTWLAQPTASGFPVVARLAELIMVNGGTPVVQEIGRVEQGGLYGRTGLTVEEALELVQLNSFLQGMLLATDGRDGPAVKQLIEQEIDKQEARSSGGAE